MGQSRVQRIEVLPTGAALGADIEGVDVSGELDDEVFRLVYEAWNDHLVLRFRGQRLNDDALIAFARRFGDGDGQIFALTVMVVAAAEAVVGLGLIVAMSRQRVDLDVDKLTSLRG
jgi:NADH-ubiquinone/plastoquinone oxidoreductase chain 4L/Taurine catabolism dioxygenase TauD, TfdA family